MKRLLLTGVAFGVLIAGPAVAADLAPVYRRPVVVAAPVYTWTGFYAGLNAGGTWSNNNSVSTTSTVNSFTSDPGGFFFPGDPAGWAADSAAGATGIVSTGKGQFIGGAQIGYNQQFNSIWVGGIEADIQGLGGAGNGGQVSNTQTLTNFFPCSAGGAPCDTMTTTISASKRLDYFGTLRARLGALAAPTLLAYVTGGLAYGGVHSSTSIVQTNDDAQKTALAGGGFSENPINTANGSISQTRAGWTAGGGFEWLLGRDVSAKVEYLYYDLGSVSYASLLVSGNNTPTSNPTSVVTATSTTRFSGSIVRVGLNYKFGYAAAPAVYR
jgi:outer membrane immunogenic protein